MRKYAAHTALATLGFAACASDPTSPGTQAAGGPSPSRDGRSSSSTGAVYTMTNATTGNAVLAFRRAADGTLSRIGAFATGGTGTGGAVDPLQSQYSVILSDDHRLLYAVDAGSNTVTSFRVADDGALARADHDASGGSRPISLALSGNLLYVLNAGDNVVRGYRATPSGTLAPLPHAAQSLAAGADGALAVAGDGQLTLVSPPGPVASTGAGSAPLDPAFSSDDAFLYVLKAGVGTIGAFRVGADHGLTAVADTPAGAPASGLQGLAAY